MSGGQVCLEGGLPDVLNDSDLEWVYEEEMPIDKQDDENVTNDCELDFFVDCDMQAELCRSLEEEC